MRDGMLVHRESDDTSEDDNVSARSSLRAGGAAPVTDKMADAAPSGGGAVEEPLSPDGAGSADDGAVSGDGSALDPGKTHMIGDALKSVYQRTLEEDIPDDFLDLLKQLK